MPLEQDTRDEIELSLDQIQHLMGSLEECAPGISEEVYGLVKEIRSNLMLLYTIK